MTLSPRTSLWRRLTTFLLMGAAGGLVLAFAFGDRGHRSLSKVFKAPRAERAVQAEPETGQESRIAAVVYAVTADLTQSAPSEASRTVAVNRLTAAFEAEQLSDAAGRTERAQAYIDELASRGGLGASAEGLSHFQMQAMEVLAARTARQMVRDLSGFVDPSLPAVQGASGALVPWSMLTDFRYERGMQLPSTVRGLNGTTVEVRGFLLYLERTEGKTWYLLVESLWDCCFGEPPGVNRAIVVGVDDALDLSWTPSPVRVAGALHVGEDTDEDDVVTSIYRMTARSFSEDVL